jgi:predicted enzyme related to lactoylglutathione lyase
MPARTDFTPGEFCWIDLNAHDLEAAAAWYGALFGWTRMDMPTPGDGPPYAFLMMGEAPAAGVGQMNDEMRSQGIPPLWNSYVCVEDCEASEQRAAELGGSVMFPTQDIPGHGKLCFITDPEGGCIAFWQSTGEQQNPVFTTEPGGLSWNELMCRDTAKAHAFYGALFGWTFADMPMQDMKGNDVNYTLISTSGGKQTGGMMAMDGPDWEGMPTHWMVYFATADIDATAAKVAATGGTIVVPPTPIQVGKFSVVRDPQGGHFSLIQMNPQE